MFPRRTDARRQTPSGRTQVDGPTQVTDLDATEKNKAAVNAYFQDVVFGAHPDRTSQYKNLGDFHQHNCYASDLKNGVPFVKPAFTFKIQKLERILRGELCSMATGS